MGKTFSRRKVDIEIKVKTGDVKGAGTDSNVHCCLIDTDGVRSKDFLLDCKLRNDFEKGSEDIIKINNAGNLGTIECIELWRDCKGLSDDWFVECIKVRTCNKGIKQAGVDNIDKIEKSNSQVDWIPFPCTRWIEANRKYCFCTHDSILPQFDNRLSQRQQELVDKRTIYAYEIEITGRPRRIKTFPACESFSNDYKWDITARKIKYKMQSMQWMFEKWESLADIQSVYGGAFEIPYGFYNWTSDAHFAKQRLTGCNATVIKQCCSLPSKFVVTSHMVEPFLDGLTLDEAMVRKQIYIVDFNFLDGIYCGSNRTLCCPFALFFVKKCGEMVPIAIQLFQQSCEDNPVFLPSDPPYTWILAKMFYNNADCAYHQACAHFGFTHLVCESICVAVHRCLSPSHPLFRLLAPHFLYLIAINELAVNKLLAPGGWIDISMTPGSRGILEIAKRKWGVWMMDVDGWLPNDLKNRGVDNKETLPGYYYRDDAELIHQAIYDYVNEIVADVYDTTEKLLGDYEVQNWAAVLSDPVDGAGIKGVFGGGAFEDLGDLIKTITAIIFMSSVQHAAANFCQYDEYGFPPNYPAILHGEVIRDKQALTETNIIAALPDKETTLSIMVITRMLSERGTKGLGDFEMQYQYEPKTVAAVEKFKTALREISVIIKIRNATLKQTYPYLDPEEVPNSISI